MHYLHVRRGVLWMARHFDRLMIAGMVGWSLLAAFTFPEGKKTNRIWSDAEGYYAYLPAVFIYGSFENLPIRTPNQFPVLPETRRVNLKTTYGVALLQTPFFLTAHLIATQGWFRVKDRTGFEDAYSDSVIVSAIFYTLIALLLLSSLLRNAYSPVAAGFTLAILYWGTNWFYYVIGQGGVSHAYSFFLNTWVMYSTYQCLAKPSRARFAWLGLGLGLAVLIRPTNLLMALFPLLAGVNRWNELGQRVLFFLKNLSHAWIAVPVGLVVFLPQLVYWHHISGQWVYYSYGEEGFIYWKSPYLFSVFFSVLDGLFIYSPLIALGWLGLFRDAWYGENHGRAALLIVAVATYAIASWWAWWFGGSFGHRAFIDWYPLMAFGCCGLVQWGWRQGGLAKVCFLAVAGLGMYYSITLGYAYRYHWSDLTWTWELFGQALSAAFLR